MSSTRPATYRISQLARRYGLSRSTLLHYDRIGLLKPSARGHNDYRSYNDHDRQRLEQILTYRRAGLSLDDIAQLLDRPDTHSTQLLQQRLQHINHEISGLRRQQQLLLQLLGKDSLLRHTRILTKHTWTQLLRDSGMNDDDMRQWHIQFEHSMPEQHQDFLESLGIGEDEIRRIRAWAKGDPLPGKVGDL